MDIDPPSSPPQQQQQQPPLQQAASFTVPITNGGTTSPPPQGDIPVPPPHKSQPSSPKPSPAEEAESFKNLGNKFFKEKNYARAIEEYTKGTASLTLLG